MLLLGLSGAKRSGKNLAADAIIESLSAAGFQGCSRAFADLMKLSMARLFWPDIEMDDAIESFEALKSDRKYAFSVGRYAGLQGGVGAPMFYMEQGAEVIDARTFMQRFGTEAHREVFGYDFWVDQLLPYGGSEHAPEWHRSFPEGTDVAIITDVRFTNEAQRIRNLGGLNYNIVRSGYGSDGHVSEEGLPEDLIDRVITNDFDIDTYNQTVIETFWDDHAVALEQNRNTEHVQR